MDSFLDRRTKEKIKRGIFYMTFIFDFHMLTKILRKNWISLSAIISHRHKVDIVDFITNIDHRYTKKF